MQLRLGNNIVFAILFLLKIYKNCVTGERTCYACHGIKCLRTSYNITQSCVDDFDICVSVFEGQTVVYQGCLEQLSEELRNKCNLDLQAIDQENSPKLSECFKCNGNLCNNMASKTFNCIQCDSNSDINCRSKPENLIPARCPMSRTPNEYCFSKQEGDRIVRGCLQTLEQQAACLSSEDCMICQPSEISNCNDIALPIDSGVNGSEDNEGDSSINTGGDANNNSGSGSSESAGEGSGNSTFENGSNGSNNESNANDNSGGENSDSGADSANGGSGSQSDGSAPDGSGNSSSTNGTSGSNNGGSGNDNGEGATSGDGSNGSSITIVSTYIWIFTIFLNCLFMS